MINGNDLLDRAHDRVNRRGVNVWVRVMQALGIPVLLGVSAFVLLSILGLEKGYVEAATKIGGLEAQVRVNTGKIDGLGQRVSTIEGRLSSDGGKQ